MTTSTAWRTPLIVAASLGCSGCFGLAVDKPWNETFDNPRPRRVNSILSTSTPPKSERWQCRPESPPPAPTSTKEDFRQAWGEPGDRRATRGGEEWIYREDWRWCGVWVSFVLPIPLMLPICTTQDRVEFEDEMAVRSSSRRRDIAAAGIFIYPAIVILIPIPFASFPSAADGGPFPEYWPKYKGKC